MTFSLSSGMPSAITVSEMTVTDWPFENVTYNIKHMHHLTMDFIFHHVVIIKKYIFIIMSSKTGLMGEQRLLTTPEVGKISVKLLAAQ